jgi:rod shape-determining protein MreB and related proteins
MARDLAIDLGTANTLVYMKGKGIVLNEPSVIALNRQTGEVLATGREAWQMIGRTPGYIVAVRPLRGGAITDFEITERMIRLLLQRVGVSRFTRPKVVICVPSAITEVERRAVTDAARRAGAADAQLIEQPMAAAIGADLPIDEPVGNMVIDIGGGTSETAVISLGGIVALEAVRVGSTPPFRHTCVASTASQSASEQPKRSRSPSALQTRPRTRARPRCVVAT